MLGIELGAAGSGSKYAPPPPPRSQNLSMFDTKCHYSSDVIHFTITLKTTL